MLFSRFFNHPMALFLCRIQLSSLIDRFAFSCGCHGTSEKIECSPTFHILQPEQLGGRYFHADIHEVSHNFNCLTCLLLRIIAEGRTRKAAPAIDVTRFRSKFFIRLEICQNLLREFFQISNLIEKILISQLTQKSEKSLRNSKKSAKTLVEYPEPFVRLKYELEIC